MDIHNTGELARPATTGEAGNLRDCLQHIAGCTSCKGNWPMTSGIVSMTRAWREPGAHVHFEVIPAERLAGGVRSPILSGELRQAYAAAGFDPDEAEANARAALSWRDDATMAEGGEVERWPDEDPWSRAVKAGKVRAEQDSRALSELETRDARAWMTADIKAALDCLEAAPEQGMSGKDFQAIAHLNHALICDYLDEEHDRHLSGTYGIPKKPNALGVDMTVGAYNQVRESIYHSIHEGYYLATDNPEDGLREMLRLFRIDWRECGAYKDDIRVLLEF